jgi:hypothetical protein
VLRYYERSMTYAITDNRPLGEMTTTTTVWKLQQLGKEGDNKPTVLRDLVSSALGESHQGSNRLTSYRSLLIASIQP